MKKNKIHRSYYLFGLLFVYIAAQFFWWGNLLYSKYEDLALYKTSQEAADILRKAKYMLLGEGSVFIIILIIILVLAFRSINQELKLANRQKNFLLSVSHELKTPITTSRSIIQTMLSRKLPENKQHELLETLLGENQRFSDLVNNVFIAQRLETGQFTLSRQPDNFSDFLSKNLASWQSISAPEMELTTNIQENISFSFDKTAIETLIHNLFSNAQKYSDGNKRLTVELSQKQAITLRVSDEGQGISKEELKQIFKLFYRIENEETRKSKGTGLGLYICKNIVEEHGGKILAKANKNRGTIFEITFNAAS